MRRIKNSDIKIYYNDFKGITPNFKLLFYTTNSEYAIERTVTDLLFDPNDDNLGYIILNWSELQTIGKGVMNYTLFTYQNDSDFDDGVYDKSFARTTEYFIDSNVIIDDEDEDKTIGQLIAEVDVKVNQEITRSSEKDIEHDEALAILQNEYDYLEDRHRRDIAALTDEKANRNELATVATTGDYNDLINKPNIPTVPTNVSSFTNDSGYLTSHQDISGKADKADTYTKAQVNSAIAALDVDDLEDRVDQLETDYMNLSQAHARDIEAELTARQNADETLQSHIDTEATARQNADTALQTAINAKANSADLATVATSGSYNDLTNKPTIPTVPTNVSAFTNDAGYLTQHQSLNGYATETWVQNQGYTTSSDISDMATQTDLAGYQPLLTAGTGISISNNVISATGGGGGGLAQVQSDWNQSDSTAVDYIKNKPTIPTVPSNVSAFTNDAGYLTQHQDISGKANSADLATVATSGSYNDLTNKPTIPTVPTNVSAFTNDAGYLTSHQSLSGYATQTWVQQQGYAESSDLSTVATSGSYNDLSDKPTIPTVPTNVSAFTNDAGYLTSHQSLSGYATESWVSTNYYNKTYIDTTIGNIETLLSNI